MSSQKGGPQQPWAFGVWGSQTLLLVASTFACSAPTAANPCTSKNTSPILNFEIHGEQLDLTLYGSLAHSAPNNRAWTYGHLALVWQL